MFRADGTIAAIAQQEFPQHFPQSGWVEHDPEDLWRTVLSTGREVIAKAGLAAPDIAAIGITNQRETTLVWDRASGTPIHNTIVWQDRRTAGMGRNLKDTGHEALVAARTGLVLDPYFSASKIAGLLDHVPGARAKAERGALAFGTVRGPSRHAGRSTAALPPPWRSTPGRARSPHGRTRSVAR